MASTFAATTIAGRCRIYRKQLFEVQVERKSRARTIRLFSATTSR
jgi:hypothetical protein